MAKKVKARSKDGSGIKSKEGKLIYNIFMKHGSIQNAADFLGVTRQRAYRWCVFGHIPLASVSFVAKKFGVSPLAFNFKGVNELLTALKSDTYDWKNVVKHCIKYKAITPTTASKIM